MVPKHPRIEFEIKERFRAVLFRMVPKQNHGIKSPSSGFRAVLFRMVPKLTWSPMRASGGFRAVLFRMVPKRYRKRCYT